MEIYKSDQSPVIYANGMPVPTGGLILTHEQVSNSLKASLVEEYDGPDPKKQGMSKLDAGMCALANQFSEGDKYAIGMVLDRVLGKPVQQVNSTSITGSLKDFLAAGLADVDNPGHFSDNSRVIDIDNPGSNPDPLGE